MSLLEQGAKAAITQCLETTPQDRVVIISDEKTFSVGNALEIAAKRITPNVKRLVIENYIKRPAQELPQKLKDEIEQFKPTISIYAAQGQPGELPDFRRPLVDFLYKDLHCRHAHMIGISEQLMEDGMNKDYDLVYKVTNRVCDLCRQAKQLVVTDPFGTNATFDLSPDLAWIPSHGKIKSNQKWQNLPSGETFTSPASANGIFVAWVLGDDLSEKHGELKTPLTVSLKDGYITLVSCDDANIKKDFDDYIHQYPDGNRAGELGVGTLVGLDHFIGNLLQDEKFPGVHVAFGHPYPDETGAKWDAPSHIDIIAKQVTINLIMRDTGEEKVIMRDGIYISEILQ
ncbi:MAG TPA: hypothetical protein VLI92_02315 [Candidatus Saccharimonadales bacterium]|nr:hypothetical protein [Candidatus Saccharimonadales bacterium]